VVTEVYGINDQSQIVGLYVDAQELSHGFLYDKGLFTTIDLPGALHTEAYRINNEGQIAGLYNLDDEIFAAGGARGFLATPIEE
jgi:uncharacterized membrane protein